MKNYTLLELKKICLQGCSENCPFAYLIFESKGTETKTWNCMFGGRYGVIPREIEIDEENNE